MKILIVASFNKGRFAPFILEQAEALKRSGLDVRFFGVKGKGISGYLKSLPALKRTISQYGPDIIHAHYGLCGVFANIQRKIPVVTTYHGSDINDKRILPFSKLSMLLSQFNIFVSESTLKIASQRSKYILLPCGIDLDVSQLVTKSEARQNMGMHCEKSYVLFAGAYNNPVKNSELAISAMQNVPGAELIELKGYTREQVSLLMCAADCFLMTSLSEGSPQVIKEAMACGCPIVSVDVGDVKDNLAGIDGCYIVPRDPNVIASAIKTVLAANRRISGRERLVELGLTNDIVAAKLMNIYNGIIR